jgi:hypothetical protein
VFGSAPKIGISGTSSPKDVLNGMTDKGSLKLFWGQWTHKANIKNALEMHRLNTCNVDNKWLVPPTVLLHSFAVSVQWNAQIVLCDESITSTGWMMS